MPRTVLPPNATALEVALDTNNAKRFDALMVATDESSKTWSASDCPAALLPFLAWALSVDTWNPDWPEKVKRQVIASSVFVHRHKGTRAGIDTALKALDLGVTLSEWFEHGGDPYTFRADVDISGRGITGQEISDIFDVIYSTKNARSFLERLRVFLAAPLTKIRVATLSLGQTLNIGAYIPKLPVQHMPRVHAMGLHSVQTISIGAANV